MNGLREADTLLGAADARVATTDRPGAGADIAEQDGRAIGVGFRTLAAKLVQTKACLLYTSRCV